MNREAEGRGTESEKGCFSYLVLSALFISLWEIAEWALLRGFAAIDSKCKFSLLLVGKRRKGYPVSICRRVRGRSLHFNPVKFVDQALHHRNKYSMVMTMGDGENC